MSSQYGLVIQGRGGTVPLESVAVSGDIKGYVVGLDTTLSYRNPSDDPLEVMFRFPVDEGMAVVGLEAKIDGRTIHGVVQEKEQARATYDDAIASGLTAALGEEKTGDIFSLALGNLPPKGEAQLLLKLAGELPVEEEAVRFSLPTVLKPRYTPQGSVDPLAPISSEGTQVEKGHAPAVSSFSLKITNPTGISSVTSPTHGINTTDKGGLIEVTLKEQAPLDKDLVVLINYNEPHTPHATVENGREGTNELLSNPAVMLDFFPKFTSLQAACEFVFVVDRSGSMSGAYINSAKETLVLFLKSIPPGCYFNIIGFGSRYEHLFPKSVPYNQTNLDKAMKLAQTMQANLGGTELLQPLNFVFGQKLLPGLPRQVFVLTDGSVSNTQACIDETKKNSHVARVFTFGIGSGASSALVKGLARAGNGSAEFIKEGERMQSKVISSLKKALQPSVTDVELTFSVPAGVRVLQAPSKIPPIFNGDKLVLYGILKGGGTSLSGHCSVILKGKVLGSDIEHRIEFEVGSDEGPLSSLPIVHQLAAKSLIKDWEDKAEKKAAIIKMSVESSVVSSLTAYVAVDEDQDKPIEGAIKTWDLTAIEVQGRPSGGFRGGGFGGSGVRAKFKFAAPRSRNIALPKGAVRGEMLSSAELNDERSLSALQTKGKRKKNSAPGFAFMSVSCESSIMADEMDDEDMPTLSTSLHSSQSATGSSTLSQLVALQSAEGFWTLDQSLASLIGCTLVELKSTCPAGCTEVMWATLLALAFLEKQFTSHHDEWELVAMKAEFWLQSQPLPSTVDSLKQIASQNLK